MTSYIEHFKQRLMTEEFYSPHDFKGCTEEEINAVMQAQGVKRLPAVFADYLRVMGKEGLEIQGGSGWTYDDMFDLKEMASRWVGPEDGTVPDDAFVFFEHGAYEFRWFLTDNDDDNPPVYIYGPVEGQENSEIRILANSLTDYFDMFLARLKWMREAPIRKRQMRDDADQKKKNDQ